MSSNIKVGIRVRPLISKEKNEKLKEQWEVNENSMYPVDVTSRRRNGDIYYFDHIFDKSCCNADIYSTIVHPVVDKAMNGFNGTIFAYGQTSSGKTFTMMGDTNEDGLISLAVQNIFLAIEQSVNRKFLLRVSYIEIYNEKIYDLLDIKSTVKISEDYNGSVIVNVKEEVTACAEQVYDIMKKGEKNRRIGETNMNEKSSRSHTIFRIIIESSDINNTGVVNVAHLNLVDLAGSERATFTKATGQRLKEGAHINKSLSTLSLVMKQLSESQDFINFRDSKLTRILQPSLGGNALTAIICAVTPAALEETHSTLAFASRAKSVKNKPLLNEVVTDEALINRYALEINKLKRDLEKANDNRTLQAQKIAVLEKCILFPKKTSNSNKNRRKTWSAPNDPLPVIYETDILRVSDRLSIGKSDNLESEAISFEDYSLSTSPSEKTPCSTSPRSNTLSLLESKCSSNGQPVKKSEDVVKWLIHSATETPKSVLRERAEYYEYEFNSLKELTTREKIILSTDHNTNMEMLQAELTHIKSELENEKQIRKEQETKLLGEKKLLQSKFDDIKKKNDELSTIIQKVQKNDDQKNDCEFLVEMYKEKYKKREKELLDSLKEARDQLKSSSNNTDDEKNQIISTDESSISVDMKVFLEECKNQLSLLKSELESEQPMSVIQKIFNEVKKLNEEMLGNCNDCSDDLQDLLNVFKYMLDLSCIMLSDDTVILDLEKEKRQLQHREKTYELLVSKQDEEIKHLSQNILQYMNELAFHKNEVIKYKDIAKSESSLQTDLDFSIMTTDTKNMTDYDINNDSTLNQSELILKTDQYVQTEEDILGLVQSKDKEIEDLSDKIMEYIDQLSALEQELNQLKSLSNSDQLRIDDKLVKEKDDTISELMTTVHNYNEKINEYISELQSQKDEIKEKDTEIEDLSDNIMNYLSEINDLKNEINLVNVQLQSEKHLLNTKDEEIKNLSNQINTYNSQLSSAEEEIKNLKLTSTTQDLIEAKEKQIIDLTEKVTSYSKQLKEVLEEFDKYKSDVQTEQNLVDMKNKEIEKLKIKLSDIKEELQILQTEMKMKELRINTSADNDLIQITDEITKLTEEVKSSSEQVSVQEKYEAVIEAKNHEIREKDKGINDLSSKLTEYEIKLIAAENELRTFKSNLEKEISIQANNLKEKQDLETQLSVVKEELQKYKLVTEEEKDSSQIIELTETLYALQNEVEKYKHIITTKDKEIQEVLCKLTAAENEICNCISNADIDRDIIESKNAEIKEMRTDINNYINQLAIADEVLKKYESDLQIQKDLTEAKTKEFDILSENIFDHVHKLSTTETNLEICENDLKKMKSKIRHYINQLSTAEEEIKRFEDLTNELEKLTDLKNLEIQELNSKLLYCNKQIQEYQEEIGNINKDKVNSEYLKAKQDLENANKTITKLRNDLSQISVIEELLTKSKLDVEKAQRLLQLKETEINELSEKINLYRNLVSSKDEEFIKYETQIEEDLNLIKLKDQEIMDVTKQLVKYESEIFEKDKIINDYKRDLELEKDINKRTEMRIHNIREEYSNQNAEFKEEIDNLKSSLNEKSKIIVCRENDIKTLNGNINQYAKKLQELNLHNETLTQLSSEYEILKMKIKAEEVKSIEYVNKIRTLEQQILSFNDQAKQMKQEYEVVQSSNLQYSTMIENLQTQICTLQGHITQQESILKQLELDRNTILENNTLLRNASLTDIQKATDKLKEQSKYIENLQTEVVKLKKKNEDYKKIVQQVTDKANSKIGSYNNMVVKLKQDNELLKMQLTAEKETYRTTHIQLVALQNEMKKVKSGLSDSDLVKLQTKINNLEETNRQLIQVIENHQEQIHMKTNEYSAMKKTVETLKYENLDLHKITKNLNDKLCETEVLLKSAKINVQLLEKENENYNESTRNLQESLENVKYELYELKNKEREKFKKAKRQSLHDSSRSLSSDEHLNITVSDENQQMHLPSFESSKSNDTKSSESERCKQRMPLVDKQIDEQRDKVSELQNENEKLRKKCDQIQNLCRLRKNKIDELERQVRSYSNQ